MSFILKILVITLSTLPALADSPTDQNPLSVKEITVSSAAEAHPDQNLEVHVRMFLEPGYHAYLDRYKFELIEPKDFSLSEFLVKPTTKFLDPISKKTKDGTEGFAEMVSLLRVPKRIISGDYNLKFTLTYQACGDGFCLFPKKIPVTATITVKGNETPNFVAESLQKGWLYTLVFVFIAGVLTSLTPCIFPMLPITLAILGTKEHYRTKLHGFLLSLFYVFGIAITYSILGVIAAKTGSLFGSMLGNPIVVSVIAGLFVLMGLSMYGLFEVQMPLFITNRLAQTHTKQGFIGAFGSGLIAGVVASPCVGPVLVSILTYVAQTQNTFKGFILLFTFAFGLGQLFLVMGTFNNLLHKLPRSGRWMERVKYIFGTIMMFMALYYIYPVVKNYLPAHKTESVDEQTEKVASPIWVKYNSALITQAQKEGRPVIIDFKAEWCLACKELDQYTFSDPRVIELGKRFLWLEFDATSPSDELEALQKKFSIGGLPFVLVYGASGEQRKDLTLAGFEKADEFLKRMENALAK
jgi:thiol:disulfide interchange protein DsbD